MLYGRDGGRFAARNRLNRDGDAAITTAYGGGRDYGPPYHVHTFNAYFPPGECFSKHPEWYSLLNAQRVAEGGQLCLTDPALRSAFLAKLTDNIDRSWAAAKAAGAPPPLVFSVSQNDCLNPCQCDRCQAIARAEDSECGPLLDLVTFLADGIKDKHPEVYLDTLAYQYTQKAPKNLRPRDNVIVRLCDTESDPSQPITAPVNTAFREHLARWSEIARNLRIWGKSNSSRPKRRSPMIPRICAEYGMRVCRRIGRVWLSIRAWRQTGWPSASPRSPSCPTATRSHGARWPRGWIKPACACRNPHKRRRNNAPKPKLAGMPHSPQQSLCRRGSATSLPGPSTTTSRR
jgi:hypothetical protein